MLLFGMFYDKREYSMVNAFSIGELTGESPAVLAIRYDDQ